MNFFQLYKKKIHSIIKEIKDIDQAELTKIDYNKITVETPREASHGDLSCNAALVLSKQLKISPRDFARIITEKLEIDPNIENIQIAGPGFINIKFTPKFWQDKLLEILQYGFDYAKEDIGSNEKINIEYVSANPTGPMHIGHCRGAVVGDVLANILKFTNHDVTKEYYVNDAGGQIEILAQSVLLRYKQALGENISEIPPGLYPGEYLIDLGQKLAQKYGKELISRQDKITIIKDFAVAEMMALIKQDLLALNVKHDLFFSEKSLHENDAQAIKEAINELQEKGWVYRGTLQAPKGQKMENWEEREQLLFRSTDIGDDQDRALVKSDDSYTYFASDVAYFYNKYKRGFKKMIYILGADHGGYVKRLQAVCQAITSDKNNISILLCQLVKLMRNGHPEKMSKRGGSFVTLRDVIEEVGRDPVRFMMIFRKNDMSLDFDLIKVKEQSKDNPVFYVQYAVARCHSIFRQAKEQSNLDILSLTQQDYVENIKYLQHESEINIIKKLANFPQIIYGATLHREPHRLAFYLYELASLFHAQWGKGNENSNLRFIQSNNKNVTIAKLSLVRAICNILTIGLNIIDVDAPTTMS